MEDIYWEHRGDRGDWGDWGIILWMWPREVVLILLGDKWLGAVPLIRILAVFGVVRSIESGIQPVFLASGKPKVATIGNLIKVVTLVLGLVLLTGMGINGVAWAALLSGMAVIPYYGWELGKLGGLGGSGKSG